MQIRVGYELVYQCPQPTPMVVTLSIHYSRASDIVKPDHLLLSPSIPVTAYRDSFGNWCSRIVAPRGTAPAEQRCRRLRHRQPRPGRALARAAARGGAPRRDLALPARQQVLRDRPVVGDCLAACSARRRPAGSASRPSATSCINTFSSATAFRAQRRPRFKSFRTARACVATLPISPSRSAVA